jgi:aromatic ring-opening dioxygenase catalytic subunit (LigB family)
LTTKDETRGLDGRGIEGPGLDLGVFVPFNLMFGEDFRSVPIVEASMDGSLSPEGNWALGKAITSLRCVQCIMTVFEHGYIERVYRNEGVLILSGGATIHNLGQLEGFNPEIASLPYHQFNDAVTSALSVSDVSSLQKSRPHIFRA